MVRCRIERHLIDHEFATGHERDHTWRRRSLQLAGRARSVSTSATTRRLTENLPVVTNDIVQRCAEAGGSATTERTYGPGRNTFLGHLVLHLSIGQAY